MSLGILLTFFCLPGATAQNAATDQNSANDQNAAIARRTAIRIVEVDTSFSWPQDVAIPASSRAKRGALLSYYNDLGYLAARLDSTGDGGRPMFVTRGPLSLIGAIAAPGLSDAYLPILESAAGEPLSTLVLESTITRILEGLTSDGFLAADVRVRSAEPAAGGVKLTLDVVRGMETTVQGIRLEGDERSGNRLAFDLAGVFTGMPASEVNLKMVRASLLAGGLHRSAGQAYFELSSDSTATVVIPVEPRSPGSFDMILGFLPSASRGGGQLIGSGHIELMNAFGSGRTFGAEVNRLPGQASAVKLLAEHPLAFGFPLRLKGQFEGYQQDSTYSKTSLGAGVALRLQRGTEIGVRLDRESTRPGQAGSTFSSGRQIIASSTTTYVGVDFRFVRLDNPLRPRKGFTLETLLARGERTFSNNAFNQEGDTLRVSSTANQERLTLTSRIYVPFRSKWVFVGGGDLKMIRSDALDEGELYRIGGANSLRGYDEDRFRGKTVIRALVEGRYLIDDVSYGFFFYDLGYVESGKTPISDSVTQRYPGFGLGIVFETAVGPMNLSYAMNTEEALSQGRIHLGMSFGL